MAAATALAVTALAAGGLGVPSAGAALCPDGPCVLVHLPGGTVRSVSGDELMRDADVIGQYYPVRSSAGGPTDLGAPTVTGRSVRSLLALVGANPAAVRNVEVVPPSGRPSILTADDLADPSGFQDQLLPVLYRVPGSAVVEYVRPLYDDPQDTNAQYLLPPRVGEGPDVYVYAGPILQVVGSASGTAVAVGQAIALSATTNATSANEPLAYDWTFGDGSGSTQAAPSHAFATSGTYRVVVAVEGGDGAGGVSEPISVAVGRPATTDDGSGTGAGVSTGPDAPAAGPQTGAGTRVGAAPSSTPATGGAQSTDRDAGRTSAAVRRTAKRGAAADPAKTTRPAVRSPGAGPSPGATAPSVGSPPVVSLSPTPASTSSPSSTQTPTKKPPFTAAPAGPLVQGRVIDVSAAVPVAAATSRPAGPARSATAPAAGAGGGWTLGKGVIAGAAVLALLGAGAALELRGRPRLPTGPREA